LVSPVRLQFQLIQLVRNQNVSQESNRFDTLSQDKQEVAQMLHMHLDKDCFGEGNKGDYLMS
jgi:hypothetical protein